jgi:hypothetical protein
MQSLNSLIGKEVSITLLRSEESSYTVTLHGVEQGGIWIESREIEKLMGHDAKKRSKGAPTEKPVFFIPFSSLFFLIASSVELDERTLQGM